IPYAGVDDGFVVSVSRHIHANEQRSVFVGSNVGTPDRGVDGITADKLYIANRRKLALNSDFEKVTVRSPVFFPLSDLVLISDLNFSAVHLPHTIAMAVFADAVFIEGATLTGRVAE